VTIDSPAPNGLVGDALTVQASSSSIYEITAGNVVVAGGTLTSSVGSGSQWTGQLSFLGALRGKRTLTVTLTDATGAMASGSVDVILDRPPAIAVSQPATGAIVSSPLTVKATCSDDDPAGCQTLRVSGNGFTSVDGTDHLDTTVSFPALDGALLLQFDATDSAGQAAHLEVTVYAVSSPTLRFVGQALTGTVLDYDPNRILLTDNGRVWIRTFQSSTDSTIQDDPTTAVSLGGLTVTGAVFLVSPSRVLQWNGTQIQDLNATFFNTNGTQVAVQKAAGGVELRDVASSNLLASLTGNLGALGPPSRLIYYHTIGVTTFQDVRFWYGGTDISLPGTFTRNPWEMVPGDNLAIVTPQAIVNGPTTVYPNGAASEVLCPDTPNYCIFRVGGDYVAYQQTLGSPPPVYLRAPNGTRQKVSPFAGTTTLEGVNASGDVMMSSGGRRYLARNGQFPTDLGGTIGTVRTIGSDWYVLVDRSVFRYDFTPAGDGGVNSGSDGSAESSVANDGGLDSQRPADAEIETSMPAETGGAVVVDATDDRSESQAVSQSIDAGREVDGPVVMRPATGPAVASDASASEADASTVSTAAPTSSDDGGCSLVPRRTSSRTSRWIFAVTALALSMGIRRRRRARRSY
jgi:hypothetical protein